MVASSASVALGSVSLPSSALRTRAGAPSLARLARILMAANWSLSEAGQASTRRWTRPGESRASRTAAEHPNDPPSTVTGPPGTTARTCSASAAQLAGRRSRSGAATVNPSRSNPERIPGRRQNQSAPMSSHSPPWISSSVGMPPLHQLRTDTVLNCR